MLGGRTLPGVDFRISASNPICSSSLGGPRRLSFSHLFCHVCVILSDFLVANFKVAFVLTNEFHGLRWRNLAGVEGASFGDRLM